MCGHGRGREWCGVGVAVLSRVLPAKVHPVTGRSMMAQLAPQAAGLYRSKIPLLDLLQECCQAWCHAGCCSVSALAWRCVLVRVWLHSASTHHLGSCSIIVQYPCAAPVWCYGATLTHNGWVVPGLSIMLSVVTCMYHSNVCTMQGFVAQIRLPCHDSHQVSLTVHVLPLLHADQSLVGHRLPFPTARRLAF